MSQVENMPLWSLKQWTKYLNDLGRSIISVRTFNKSWQMTVEGINKKDEGPEPSKSIGGPFKRTFKITCPNT